MGDRTAVSPVQYLCSLLLFFLLSYYFFNLFRPHLWSPKRPPRFFSLFFSVAIFTQFLFALFIMQPIFFFASQHFFLLDHALLFSYRYIVLKVAFITWLLATYSRSSIHLVGGPILRLPAL